VIATPEQAATHEGPHVIVLHGALGAADQCAALAAELVPRARVHVLELEGHGSTRGAGRPFRVEHFAGNVLASIEDGGIPPAAIFGFSMGGYVALWLARHHPGRVTRVVTLGTKLRWSPELAARERSLLDPAAIRARVPRFAEQLARRHVARRWEEVVGDTSEMMEWMGVNAPLGESDLRVIAHPVRLMVGDRDATVSVEESAEASRWLPAGELEVLPRTPHPFERLEVPRLARSVAEFLA
jgi:pimeloyl-ACP methyl ester carboxylesterase